MKPTILDIAHVGTLTTATSLITPFLSGTPAASERATTSLKALPPHQATALLASLPTAVPPHNAPPLAAIAVHLAVAFGPDHAAPLHTFLYADPPVTRVALRTLVRAIAECRTPEARRKALKGARSFFKRVLRTGARLADRVMAVAGLVDAVREGADEPVVVRYVLCLTFGHEEEEGEGDDECYFCSFLFSSLSRIANEHSCFLMLFKDAVVQAVRHLEPEFITLLFQHPLREAAVNVVGLNVVLHAVMSVAALSAFRGGMERCAEAFRIADGLLGGLEQVDARTGKDLHPVVVAVGNATCVSVLAVCAGGEEEEEEEDGLARIVERVQTCIARFGTARRLDAGGESLGGFCGFAGERGCARAALMFAFLGKVAGMWERSRELANWIQGDFITILPDELPNSKEVPSSSFTCRYIEEEEEGEAALPDSLSQSTLCFSNIAVACLQHPHPRVRMSAITALKSIKDPSVSLFNLPAVLKTLEQERHPRVAHSIFSNLLLAPSLLSQHHTRRISLRTLLTLMKNTAPASPIRQLAIITLAHAASTTPSLTNLLLSQVQSFIPAFQSLSPALKAALATAVATLISARPARGPPFVPFITLCIRPHAAAIAPEACAMAFSAMRDMAQVHVLDPAKAVKIVLNAFPTLESVPSIARKSYLNLLPSLADVASDKKGRIIARKAIAVLRNHLTASHINPPSTPHDLALLSQTAASLAPFSSHDILRIAHDAEPLEHYEQEQARLQAIEQSCAAFISKLITLSATISARGDTPITLNALIQSILRAEWQTARRGKLDLDVGRLQLTAEKLRRLRQGAPDQHIDQFRRAVQTFPIGVLKSLCDLCVYLPSPPDDHHLAATALQALADARAIPPSLPWTPLLEALINSRRPAEQRAALAAISSADFSPDLAALRERSFATAENATPLPERFVGTVIHHPESLDALLETAVETQAATISHLIKGLSQLTESPHLETAASVILNCLCDPKWRGGSSDERAFADLLVKANHAQREGLLQVRAGSSRDLLSVQARLACLIADHRLVRMHAMQMVREREGRVSKEEVERIGRAARKMPAGERQELVSDLLEEGGGREEGEKDCIVGVLLAYVVGVGALLPGTLRALACLPALENFSRYSQMEHVMRYANSNANDDAVLDDV